MKKSWDEFRKIHKRLSGKFEVPGGSFDGEMGWFYGDLKRGGGVSEKASRRVKKPSKDTHKVL